MPEPKKTDPSAPPTLNISFSDPEAKDWGSMMASGKQFSSGSVGFYTSSKITNPKSGERYQVTVNIVLIGSKP